MPIRRYRISITIGGWACTICNRLSETNHRAECNTQVVKSSTVKIDFIANIETQAYRSKMCLKSTTRIENAIHVTRTKVRYGARKGFKRGGPRIEPEIYEAALHSHKRADPSVSSLERRPKYPCRMRRFDRCTVTVPLTGSVKPSVNTWLKL